MPPQASVQSAGGEAAKQPKRASKRKQRAQASAIIQSQDDGGDEIVWKVSPTAERLQSASTGGSQLRVVGESRSVLQPCKTVHNKSDPVHDILSKTSTGSAVNSAKKKKSPGMAGKLELWLSSSQQFHASKSATAVDGQVESESEDKENKPDGGAVNPAESKKGTPPTKSKTRASVPKRPSTSSQRRSLSAQKAVSASFLKGAAKQPGQRRKALLDLLDKVDDALVVKGPILIQSKLSFNRKMVTSVEETNCSANEARTTPKVEKIHSGPALPPSPPPVSAQTVEERSYHVSAIESPQHECNAHTEAGDCNTDVLTKVQVLDIRSESKDVVQLPPLINILDNQEVVHGAPETSHCMSCDPGSEVLNRLADIQFVVLEVTDGEHKESSNSLCPQKTLTLLDEHNGVERVAYLRDTWFHAVVKPGDTVNVIGEFDAAGKCVIDREHNLMVINPDLLVSGSKVGSSFSCPRRAVLEERIKSNEVAYPALMGTMLHQLFQVALRSVCPTSSLLNSEAKLIVQRQLDGLYATGVSEREACMKLVDAIPTILSWWQQYVRKVSVAPEVEFGKIHGRQRISVSEVVDIEETIWAPKYGLKGVIDSSLSLKMSNMNLAVEDHIMPFELKTGKATTGQAATEHRAQVILYTLLMSDRYMQKVGAGLLYYLHTNQTQGVEAQHAELVGLMMRRNEHANNLLKASSDQGLPSMLKNYHMCQGCRQLDTCTLYHKAQERGTGESSGLGELFDRSTNHLSNTHVQFFQQWDRLINLEAQDVHVSQSQIWRMPSRKREELGRCISSLVLDSSTKNYDEQQTSGNAFIYCFQMASSCGDISNPVADGSQSSQASLQDRPFSCGDYVLLSTENGHSAVAGGTIINITNNSILLRLSRRLRIPGKVQPPGNMTSLQVLWRIDKDETASSLAMMRFNLLQLFVKTSGDTKRRSLIVDLQIPKFESTAVADSDPAALYLRSVKDLNTDQSRAIQKIIAARDYALILGLPGTGKTSTIVHAVIALLARNSSVLLTSYTNSAVDNILLKLKKLGVDFIRVGRTEAIHPELREKALGGMALTSVKEFQSVVENAQVVGVTCLGINHALFGKRKFDVCIVDEAGQITLPVCLGPLRCANSFVLVGDHYQLPPLVRSPEAREQGMAVSLFRRLSEAHPQSTSVLQSQYRMCSGIMALANSLIYSDRLLCGSPLVADAFLHLNDSSNKLPHWLLQVVDPVQRLLFLDTDFLAAEELRMRNNIKNTTEASILLKVIQVLCDGGVDIDKIGVISPYNAQVDHIQRLATKAGFSNLEVHTVDKYQGREKDCVLISFVRSNSQHEISGSLLADWRRINVAITRAKTKLLMIGSRRTLSSTPILKLLIQKVAEVGCLLPLPPNANITTVQ